MASQESPVRINALLLSQAQAASEAFHRSVPEQISFWAEIGRLVESRLTAEQIAFLKSGLASLSVTTPTESTESKASPAGASPIDIIALARNAQTAKATEKAQKAIQAKGGVRFQASRTHPGFLEQISATGEVQVGQFRNGKFRKARLVSL